MNRVYHNLSSEGIITELLVVESLRPRGDFVEVEDTVAARWDRVTEAFWEVQEEMEKALRGVPTV